MKTVARYQHLHDTFTTRLQPVFWPVHHRSVTVYERVVNVFIQCDRFHNVFISSSYRSTPSSCRLLVAGGTRRKFCSSHTLPCRPTVCHRARKYLRENGEGTRWFVIEPGNTLIGRCRLFTPDGTRRQFLPTVCHRARKCLQTVENGEGTRWFVIKAGNTLIGRWRLFTPGGTRRKFWTCLNLSPGPTGHK